MLYSYTVPVLASPWNGLSWQDDLLGILSSFAGATAILFADYQGNPQGVIDGIGQIYAQSEYMRQGKTLAQFWEDHHTANTNDQSITIDADLYNLLLEYLNSQQQSGNASQVVNYKYLYVDPLDFEITKRNKALYAHRRYKSILANQYDVELFSSRYRFGNVKNKLLSDGFKNFYHASDLSRGTGVDFDYLMDKFETFRNNASDNHGYPTGFYRLLPWFVYGYPRDTKQTVQKGGNVTYEGFINEFMTPISGNTELYFVGSFLNPLSDRQLKIKCVIYDRQNDRLQTCSTTQLSYKIRFSNQNNHGVIEFLEGSNDLKYSQNNLNDSFFPSGSYDQSFSESIGWGATYIYDRENDFYYCPLLRSTTPGLYKVFATDADCLSYIRNGGRSSIVNNYNQNVSSVTINNDNSIHYHYENPYPDDYDDDEGEGDDSGSGSGSGEGQSAGVDYSDYLNDIIEILEGIQESINNIDAGGGSGSQQSITDLSSLMTLLDQIKSAINNIGASLVWSSETVTSLINKVEQIKSDCNDIIGYLNTLVGFETDQNGILSNILFQVTSINSKISIKRSIQDTDDNLDWLIEQLQNLMDNQLSIPESISEMLGLKFPFSLPYILVGILDLLEAPPEAPVFTLPLNFEINGTDYFGDDTEFTLDFTEFSELAEAIKFFIILEWILLLVKITPKMLSNGKEIESND